MKKILQSNLFRRLKRAYSILIYFLGCLMLLGIILSFTDIPFNLYYWLGTHDSELCKKPDYIVLLSGTGMPSPDGLMKTYFTAGAYAEAPSSHIIIAMPPDTTLKNESPELLMARELYLRGIDSSHIHFERNGYSTYTQASNIVNTFTQAEIDTISVRIVTSPEHTYRSVQTFRKVGFKFVGGSAAFETVLKENKLIKGKRKKSEKKGLSLRYNMWSYMKYEITVTREFCAILYYKVRGWM